MKPSELKQLIKEEIRSTLTEEKKYLINYHLEVYSKIHKFLSLSEKKWLIKSL